MTLFEATDDARPFVLRPGARVEYPGVRESLPQAVLWQVNEQGLRDDRKVAPRSDRFRIVTYGDSQAYGWSVDLEQTFQRRMEALDDRVEVLNLAVPGYNVADSHLQLAHTLDAFQPDLAIFLATKSDVDASLEIGTFWGMARILTWGRLIYQAYFQKAERKALRRSPQRKQFFADELDEMIRFCEQRGVPLIVGFAHWPNYSDLRAHLRPEHWLATHPDGSGEDRFHLDLLNVSERVRDFPEADDHFSAAAYEAMAELFCEQISGRSGGCCVPPEWREDRDGEEPCDSRESTRS